MIGLVEYLYDNKNSTIDRVSKKLMLQKMRIRVTIMYDLDIKPFYISKGQHAIFISPSPRGKPILRLTKEIIKTSIEVHKHILNREREREREMRVTG